MLLEQIFTALKLGQIPIGGIITSVEGVRVEVLAGGILRLSIGELSKELKLLHDPIDPGELFQGFE